MPTWTYSSSIKEINKVNARRKARRSAISNPTDLSEEEIRDALRYCRIRASNLRGQAKSLRKTHLRNCLIVAQEKEDKVKARAICLIIRRSQ